MGEPPKSAVGRDQDWDGRRDQPFAGADREPHILHLADEVRQGAEALAPLPLCIGIAGDDFIVLANAASHLTG